MISLSLKRINIIMTATHSVNDFHLAFNDKSSQMKSNSCWNTNLFYLIETFNSPTFLYLMKQKTSFYAHFIRS
jgi:hypothetical protein